MTDHDVAVATPPSNDNDDDGRLDQSIAEERVARAREDGVDLVGPGVLLGDLTKHVLETGLEVEMDEHLGYPKHDSAGRDGGNSRNGTRSKTVITEVGPVEVEVPRERDSSFEPATVRKRLDLDGTGGYVIYAMGTDVSAPGDMRVVVVGPDGEQIPTELYGFSLTIDVLGDGFTTVATFDAPSPGAYRISAVDTGSAVAEELAVGRSVAGDFVLTLVGGGTRGGGRRCHRADSTARTPSTSRIGVNRSFRSAASG